MLRQEDKNIFEKMQKVASEVMQPGQGDVWLYGSRARGDARQDSDWDILIVLNKEMLDDDDYDKVAFPFVMMGWDNDAVISPILYSAKRWRESEITPFYHNVINDRIAIA